MTVSMGAAQLRGALSKYREQMRHGRYPRELRERATAYAKGRHRAKATVAEIAGELGVTEATTRAWIEVRSLPTSLAQVSSSSPALTMLPLMVRPGPSPVSETRLEVTFPDGTKVQASGLAGRALVDTIAVLRGSR